jgi:hypothetical protein
VGRLEGVSDGAEDGTALGLTDGLLEGAPDGETDGAPLGLEDGSLVVGALDGADDGELDGAAMQKPAKQISSTQSDAAKQACPLLQALHSVPPQSMSVSPGFNTPLPQSSAVGPGVVGALDGEILGKAEGTSDGLLLGLAEGDDEGEIVGACEPR